MKKNVKDVSSNYLVLNSIRLHYPVARNEICAITELSTPSVSRIVNKFIEDGCVKEYEADSTGVGRKTKLLDIEEMAVLTAGGEYDGKTLKAAIIDAKGRLIRCDETNSQCVTALEMPGASPDELTRAIFAEVQKLIARKGIGIDKLFGIGVAMPGIIENESGVVRFSASLSWENVPFKAMLEKVSKVHCVIDNDIKAAAYAEYSSRDYNSKITALLYVDEGIGSAVIVDGVILRGITNSAGEIGHITHDVMGMLCGCGKIGCYQTNVINSFLLAEARKFSNIRSAREIFQPQIRKNTWARRIAEKYIHNVARLLDNIVCVYNPDTIIILGELINDVPMLFEEVCEEYRNNSASSYLQYPLSIKKSKYNGHSPLIGVGVLASEKFFRNVAQENQNS
ncbi:MAG: ROK family protein [Defluviitaleaceae bacterium]|nr:ROK family protein [Defluviitaleaceae bacterium]